MTTAIKNSTLSLHPVPELPKINSTLHVRSLKIIQPPKWNLLPSRFKEIIKEFIYKLIWCTEKITLNVKWKLHRSKRFYGSCQSKGSKCPAELYSLRGNIV